MEVALVISSTISAFMKHATTTLGDLLINCFLRYPGFALLVLAWFILSTVALIREE